MQLQLGCAHSGKCFKTPKGEMTSYAQKSHIIKDNHYVGFTDSAWMNDSTLVESYINSDVRLSISTFKFDK